MSIGVFLLGDFSKWQDKKIGKWIKTHGKLTIKITPTQTNKLFYPKSSYDIMLTDSNLNKTKLLEGFMTLSRSVTI
ncbi:MAG: hypothetical protein EBX24_07920 [Actinobacteria bacterium]|nr:hypothetical protein [Actinomycetota bacterium]